jgi:hypothetical protein
VQEQQEAAKEQRWERVRQHARAIALAGKSGATGPCLHATASLPPAAIAASSPVKRKLSLNSRTPSWTCQHKGESGQLPREDANQQDGAAKPWGESDGSCGTSRSISPVRGAASVASRPKGTERYLERGQQMIHSPYRHQPGEATTHNMLTRMDRQRKCAYR